MRKLFIITFMRLLWPAIGFVIKESTISSEKLFPKVIPQDTENRTGYLDLQSFSN